MLYRKIKIILPLIAVLFIAALAIPAIPASAAGSLTLDQYAGPTGTTVNMTGTGFSTTAATGTVTFGTAGTAFSSQVGSAVSITSGTFTTPFQVPVFPKGTYTITLSTTLSETATASFQIIPSISLNSTSGQIGSQITINGTGFGASQTVSGYFDNVVINTTTTDPYGSFTGLTINAPETYKGNHTIKVGDTNAFSSPVNFSINPKISVSPATVPAGGQIVITGNGFTSSSPITFTMDSTNLTDSATAAANGTFAATTVTIPSVASGAHTVKASDNSGASATNTVNVGSSFRISPQSGPAGTVISVTGSGFGASKRVFVTFNSVAIGSNPETVVSDANGNFSATITTPSTSSGSFSVSGTDGINAGSANFTVAATASSVQNKGPVGGNIPISGNGFTADASITIKYDSVPIATAKADNNGVFSASIPAPPGTAGEHKIIATDGVNSINFIFTVIPSSQTGVSSGNVGTEIAVTGSAFTPNATIIIKYDGNQVATATSDNSGSFSSSIKAPASKGGSHAISVTDGVTILSSPYSMESNSPPSPGSISPAKEEKADSLALFQWSPVSDPSGVTYTFQLAQDSGFTSILVEKPGLTTTKYQLTEKDKLPSTGADKPYYWRVKAIDGASNESAWSTPQSFVVGFTIPSWLWYIIYAVAGILLLGIGFVIGMRVERMREYESEPAEKSEPSEPTDSSAGGTENTGNTSQNGT